MEVLERDFYEFSVGGREFRLEEFLGLERRRYARKVVELNGRTEKMVLQELQDGDQESLLLRLSDAILGDEDEFFAWIMSLGCREEVTAEWVRDNVFTSARIKIMANLDRINRMGEHLGNLAGRIKAAAT